MSFSRKGGKQVIEDHFRFRLYRKDLLTIVFQKLKIFFCKACGLASKVVILKLAKMKICVAQTKPVKGDIRANNDTDEGIIIIDIDTREVFEKTI